MKNKTWDFLGKQIEAGQKLQVIIRPYGENYEIPATIINGENEGKTIVVNGGLHSGEYPGVVACMTTASEIDPKKVNGRIIIIHCLNTSGFLARVDSIVPEDGMNLNSDFYGDKNGTISRKIMAFLEDEIMKVADFILDLHSGSAMEKMASCLFFPVVAGDEVGKISLGAAASTAIEHLIASTSKDGFYSYGAQKGIPGILIERGYNNTCKKEDYEGFIQDIYLVLDHFGVLEITHRSTQLEKIVWMKTDYVESKHTGLWFPHIEPGMFVKKGGLLGTVKDFFGNVVFEYRAKADCRIMYNHDGLSINIGDNLASCGLVEHSTLL
ncbi:M14 family metallopeptidase [Intestinibacter sp.]